MSRYRLGKPQVRRLINGDWVMDGHGRKYFANEEVRAGLKNFDDNNRYGGFDIFLENGKIDIYEKAQQEVKASDAD